MDNKNMLSDEELEKVNGGLNLDIEENDWYVFHLCPNEFAKYVVYKTLFADIDPNGLVLQAVKVLDAPDRIHTDRTLKVQVADAELNPVVVAVKY